jgi:hypothetical protein
MKLTLDYYHPRHGDGQVTTLPVDLMKWERITKSKLSDLYTTRDGVSSFNIGMEDLVIMVWQVLTRQGVITETLDQFSSDLDNVEFGDVDQVDPIQAEA